MVLRFGSGVLMAALLAVGTLACTEDGKKEASPVASPTEPTSPTVADPTSSPVAGPRQSAGSEEKAARFSSGPLANGTNLTPSISGSGLFIAFTSSATNLTRADGRPDSDVYVRDMTSGKTSLVAARNDTPGGNFATGGEVSLDGNWVLFVSSGRLDPQHPRPGLNIFVSNRRTGAISLVSIGDSPTEARVLVGISRDGRYVAWQQREAIYRRDRVRGRTERVTLAPDEQTDLSHAALSADGNTIAFWAVDRRLREPNGSDGQEEYGLFILDIRQRTTRFVRWSGWERATDVYPNIERPRLSADGSRVVFTAAETKRTPSMEARYRQVYLWDRSSDRSRPVSADSPIDPDPAYEPGISADGGTVVFRRARKPCEPGPGYPGGEFGDCAADIVVLDVATGVERIASSNSGGRRANDSSVFPAVSSDGRYVTFSSRATNLVPGRPWYTCSDVWYPEARCPAVYLKDMFTGAVWLASVG